MKNIKCDEDIWGMLTHIGMADEKTLGPPYDTNKPHGENATVGLEKVFKYYLLNYLAKKRLPDKELNIDPKLDAKTILNIIEDERIRYVMNNIMNNI